MVVQLFYNMAYFKFKIEYKKIVKNRSAKSGPIWLMSLQCIQKISSVTLAKPALVYTLIHLTVTARYSCGDSLRLDSTCGRSSSFKVRREWACRPWDQFS